MLSVMRTWLSWVAVLALLAVAFGGAAWSALTGDEWRVAVLAAYAERVCVGGEVRGEGELRGEFGGPPGHETLSTYREWPTAGDAKRDLQAQKWRLRALPPPGGLGRFHAAALDALREALAELEVEAAAGPVRVYTIPMGGLPLSWGLREAYRDLPEETRDLLDEHGCVIFGLVE